MDALRRNYSYFPAEKYQEVRCKDVHFQSTRVNPFKSYSSLKHVDVRRVEEEWRFVGRRRCRLESEAKFKALNPSLPLLPPGTAVL